MATCLLTEREDRVLGAIVRNYISRASPASSHLIAKQRGFNFSPATIRNVMGALERHGLIAQPHTSAGRIPTDKGYRYYVDRTMKSVSLPPRLRRQIGDALTKCGASDLHRLLETATRTLSRVTRQLCVIVAPRLDRAVLRGVYLVPIGGRRYVLSVAVDAGMVKTIVFDLSKEIADDRLIHACRMLAAKFAGRMLADLCNCDGQWVNEVADNYCDAVKLLLAPVRRIAGGESAFPAYTEGEANVLLKPEFFNRSGAKGVRQVCAATDLLADCVRVPAGAGSAPMVAIGRELPWAALHSFAIVKAAYRVGALPGSLGVIGPKRMPYPFLISAVEYMARALGEMRLA